MKDKIAITGILATTILVAGMLAFMPAERASAPPPGGTEGTIVKNGVVLNPSDGGFLITTIIPASPSKSFRGHLSGTAMNIGSDVNILRVQCEVAPGEFNGQGLGVNQYTGNFPTIENDFACLSLQILILDAPGDGDDPAATIWVTAQFVTSSDVSIETT